jgi:protein TonB
MFEQTFTGNGARTRRPWTVMVSFAGQVLLTGLAVLLPLIYTEALPKTYFIGAFFAPSPPPGRQPAPEPAQPPNVVKTPSRQFTDAGLLAPRVIPKKAMDIVDLEIPPAPFSVGGNVGIPGGTGSPDSPLSPVISSMLHSRREVAPPPAAAVKKTDEPQAPKRVEVGGKVRPPEPVYNPKPLYPDLAKMARVSGVVRLEAIIGRDGSIQNIRLIRGHPFLAPAAIAAVKRWRYTPTLLNGSPVEVVMLIDVNFTLNQ